MDLARRSLLALVLVAGAAAPAQAEGSDSIGPYRVERDGGSLRIHAHETDDAALALLAAGIAIAAFGAVRLGAVRRRRRPWILLGLGLAAVGGVARLGGGAVWTVTREGVAEMRRFRAERRVERAAIDALEVASRRPTGVDVKSPAASRLVELRLRLRDGETSPIHFAFERESEARRLGELLAGALGVPLR